MTLGTGEMVQWGRILVLQACGLEFDPRTHTKLEAVGYTCNSSSRGWGARRVLGAAWQASQSSLIGELQTNERLSQKKLGGWLLRNDT